MKLRKKRAWLIVAVVSSLSLVLSIVGAGLWYRQMLSPIDATNSRPSSVVIAEGAGAAAIAKQLEQKKLIRSAFAFSVYVRLHSTGSGFKKGVYTVRPNQSVPDIIIHLTSGTPDQRSVIFYPEATLRVGQRSIRQSLQQAGFGDADIEQALQTTYQSPVLADQPRGADLEGYLYGDTYFLPANASAQQFVQRALDQFSKVIKQYDLERQFQAQGLTLRQGIILASIVQKESKGCGAQPVCEDQRQIASVFFNRLHRNMPLGSDVTYHYAADKAGVPRNHRLDSPYNTRIHKGLPPGPIAVPGLSALKAVADPAKTDYLFFLSGDDDVTYFGRTAADHEANIRNHCHKKCQLP